MKWVKRGLIHAPADDQWWARSHAFVPTPVVHGETIRVYFTSLDAEQFGRITFLDVDSRDPGKVRWVNKEPVLDLGERGTFDDSGVNAASVVSVNESTYLYYIGWQRAVRVPYTVFPGLAISKDSVTFERHAPVPVMDRTAQEPFSKSAPFVLREQGRFRAWYWACTGWTCERGVVRYNGIIRHTSCNDGVRWTEPGVTCIVPDGSEDFSVARPWVLHDQGIYRMWYSIRSSGKVGYRLGYAESPDGLKWERKDGEVGIGPSESGWDSEMICFGAVVDSGGKRFMFYNGNSRGRTGFGYAELEDL